MKFIASFAVAVCVFGSLKAVAQQGNVPDAGADGPYATGHTSFVVVDSTRDTGSNWAGRPVAVSVWYPIDSADVANDTPEGLFPFDPLYNVWAPPATSSQMQHPCESLPDPTLQQVCESGTLVFPPTYEGVSPSSHGPFPVVVFSPGWNGRAVAYSFFAIRLASHGFVVAVAQHYRDRHVAWDPLDPFYVAMFNRPRDVSFMLDELLTRNSTAGNVLFKSMRPDLVAAAGHSIGGYAVLTLAGGDDAICKGTTDNTDPTPNPLPAECDSIGATRPDPRIKAIVALDATNPVLHFTEMARIAVPSLSIGESVDAPGWNLFTPARQHAAISSHPNYRVDLVGALHQSFSNSCTGVWIAYRKGFVPRTTLMTQIGQPWCSTALAQSEVNRLDAKYAIAFLKTHLVHEAGYERILTPGWALTREDHVEFFVTEPKNATSLGEDPSTFRYFPHQLGGVILSGVQDPVGTSAVEQ